jgi:ribosomal protein S18 acetylase RimI-like enzyme
MIQAIEELSLNAWPSLQTMLYDGWVLRFSGGHTRRANSVNPIYPSAIPLEEKVSACERLYHAKGLGVVFKLTGASYPQDLDAFLAERGYASDAETSVQLMDLRGRPPASLPGLEVAEELTASWFELFCAMSGLSPGRQPMAWQMLRAIVPTAGFGTLRQDGAPVACGFAVAQGEYIGFFDIVTDSQYRRRGFGEQLMRGLLVWGLGKGASKAYLQVMTNNPPALALYGRLGFKEQYRYWYRVKA